MGALWAHTGAIGCVWVRAFILSAAELLVVIRETENDDLTSVMQELIETYSEQIGDVAVDLCANLVRGQK